MAGSKKTKGNYCFPNFLGKAMASVGQRVQFESSLLSMMFILIGLMVMTIATIFGTDFSLFIKIMAGVNGVAAFIFLSSHLTTTFQQYRAYLDIMGLLKSEEDIQSKEITNTQEIETTQEKSIETDII